MLTRLSSSRNTKELTKITGNLLEVTTGIRWRQSFNSLHSSGGSVCFMNVYKTESSGEVILKISLIIFKKILGRL